MNNRYVRLFLVMMVGIHSLAALTIGSMYLTAQVMSLGIPLLTAVVVMTGLSLITVLCILFVEEGEVIIDGVRNWILKPERVVQEVRDDLERSLEGNFGRLPDQPLGSEE